MKKIIFRVLLIILIACFVTTGIVFAKEMNLKTDDISAEASPSPDPAQKDADAESVFNEEEALKLLRKYAASDPLPTYMGFDENEYVRQNDIPTEKYGEFAVSHDISGTTKAVSLKDNKELKDFDIDGVSLFTKARLQFLRCPDTMMITKEEVESNGKTTFPEFANYFITEREPGNIPARSAVSSTRQAVTNSSVNPYYAICYIKMTFPNGTTGYGSGFLVNNNTVITAGHVLYQSSLGGWASSVKVYPGKNGSSEPYGYKTYSKMWVGGTWYSSSNPDGDFGVIRLSSSSGVPAHFWMQARTDTQLSGLSVTMTGYPQDKQSLTYTMWKSFGSIYDVTTYQFYFDAFGTAGVSGSPVYDSLGWVVGIATGNAPGSPGTGGSTRAVKMTQGFIDWVNGL